MGSQVAVKNRKDSLSKRVNNWLSKDQFSLARDALRKELRRCPDDHWLLTRLSSVYYEQHQYVKALELAQRAAELAPDCPLVLWDLAGALSMCDQGDEAMKIWRRLVRRGVERIAFDECGEGIGWARSLVNDCLFCIGDEYAERGKRTLAVKYLREHLAKRAPGIYSSQSLSEVKRRLREVENGTATLPKGK